MVAVEVGFAAARERLFEQFDVGGDQRRYQRVEVADRETLIGIDADPAFGPRRANRLYARDIDVEVAGELELECAGLRIVARTSQPSPRDRRRRA